MIVVADEGSLKYQRLKGAMDRALQLARRGPSGGVNPRVGCVILDAQGATLAEGWHRGVGTVHAEVDALRKLKPSAAEGATVIVTLEPCAHYGHTGPCAAALTLAGVSEVHFALSDPNAAASGGAEVLVKAGLKVSRGICEAEALELNKRWVGYLRLGRPWVAIRNTDRTAGTVREAIEGFGAVVTQSGNQAALELVEAAIQARSFQDDDDQSSQYDRILRMSMRSPAALLEQLHQRGVTSVLVEGESRFLSAFLLDGICDEVLPPDL